VNEIMKEFIIGEKKFFDQRGMRHISELSDKKKE
jgi:hypothetical protein